MSEGRMQDPIHSSQQWIVGVVCTTMKVSVGVKLFQEGYCMPICGASTREFVTIRGLLLG